jgi:Xaa-Pro aminopeptidase
MRACGLDAVVATSPVNVFYFSGYRSPLEAQLREDMVRPGGSSGRPLQTCSLVPLAGEPALVVSGRFAANAAELTVSDLRLYGPAPRTVPRLAREIPPLLNWIIDRLGDPARPSTAVAALAAAVADRGLEGGNIGVELASLPSHERAAISRALHQAVIRDCSNLLRFLRAVKTEAEIQRLTLAARVAEEAVMDALRQARAGDPVSKIARAFRIALAQRGADLEHLAVAPFGTGIAFHSHYVLQAEDALLVDFGCLYEGYVSDSATTLVVGRGDDDFLDRHAAARDAVAAGAAAARSGAAASAVYTAMRAALGGDADEESPPKGHGIGLEVREHPLIAPTSDARIRDECLDIPADIELAAGMVLNLEVLGSVVGRASFGVEQTFVVGTEGARPLSQDRAEPVRVAG